MNISSLNPQQQKAITHINGPLLILAGPGAGKTAVLSHRIAHILSCGVKPEHILAITFTNKAANEMRERVAQIIIGIKSRSVEFANHPRVTMGTFHSIGARMLRSLGPKIKIPSNFTIYDRKDQLSLLKRVWSMLNIDRANFTPAYALQKISRLKSDLVSPERCASSAENSWSELLAEVYRRYEEELRKAQACDFDDLIVKPLSILQKDSQALAFWQDMFRYILVDEFQDTDASQARLINLLANKHKNICVVGDDAQGIYGFRAADFRNILNFQKEWPSAVVVKLEQNYRSTKVIVSAAQRLISHNKHRAQKELWTENGEGEPIHILEARDEQDEARIVVDLCNKLQLPFSQTAVLFRINAQARALEEVLIRNNIPYRTVGLIRFYERKEIKDILSYLALFENPSDVVSFMRIINVPRRGLGKESVKRIAPYREELLRNFIIPDELKEKLASLAIKRLGGFIALYKNLNKEYEHTSLPEFITLLIDKIAYARVAEKSIHPEETENSILELLGVAGEFEGTAKKALGAFLERATLYSKEYHDERKGITLTTIHAAKGLEFSTVFITGLEYGVFPHYKSLLNEDELEEERRLCYVAITRAKHRLFLLYARRRNLYGNIQANPPSNFLDELPAELTVRIENKEFV